MNIIQLISSIPLFQGLPKNQIDDLSMIVTDQSFQKGEIVFSEGDEGTGFYVTINGRVKIFKLSFEGKEQILHIFGPGEIFGEVPVFAGEHFPANAEVMEESRIFFFPRDSLIALIKKNPSLALNMLAVLSRRLRKFAALIDDLSLKRSARTACRLSSLTERTAEGIERSRSDRHQRPARESLGNHPRNPFSNSGQNGLSRAD